jgi:D-alanine-D-alanine ligase
MPPASPPVPSGPVSDLEAHVPEEWWRHVFNELYLKTDGDVVENHANTRADVDLVLRALPLKVDDPVLDLCCGQGRHSLELAARGLQNVSGVDQSAHLISVARERARELGSRVSFAEGDARRVAHSDASFRAVLVMGNSFGYFQSADDDRAVLHEIRRLLQPGGTLALDVSDGEWLLKNFEPRSWEWINEHSFACRERSLSSDGSRIVCRELVVDTQKGVLADQFYATRLYTRPRLAAILEQVGFREITDHEPIFTHSDRNQDLGLMSQRMFVTGVRAD